MSTTTTNLTGSSNKPLTGIMKQVSINNSLEDKKSRSGAPTIGSIKPSVSFDEQDEQNNITSIQIRIKLKINKITIEYDTLIINTNK
jgi:hypothetical protein